MFLRLIRIIRCHHCALFNVQCSTLASNPIFMLIRADLSLMKLLHTAAFSIKTCLSSPPSRALLCAKEKREQDNNKSELKPTRSYVNARHDDKPVYAFKIESEAPEWIRMENFKENSTTRDSLLLLFLFFSLNYSSSRLQRASSSGKEASKCGGIAGRQAARALFH